MKIKTKHNDNTLERNKTIEQWPRKENDSDEKDIQKKMNQFSCILNAAFKNYLNF